MQDILVETTRPEHSSPELDAAEFAWWEEFAEIEERFCWVQTPHVQRTIRGHYLRPIAASLPDGSHVLEVGCGTGWLSLMLAEYGGATVHGADFSAEQIRRAEAGARDQKLGGRVRFHRVFHSLLELRDLAPGTQFDAVVVHGVLHHLSKSEIRTLLNVLSTDLTAPGARLFILEPVQQPNPPANLAQRLLDRFVDRLILLPLMGRRSGLRPTSAVEQAAHERIGRRYFGPTRVGGPSPKEMPFQPGELDALLETFVSIKRRETVLLFTYHVAKNLLLAELSSPRLIRCVMRPYLRFTRAVEHWMIRSGRGAMRLPVFQLFECELQHGRVTQDAANPRPDARNDRAPQAEEPV